MLAGRTREEGPGFRNDGNQKPFLHDPERGNSAGPRHYARIYHFVIAVCRAKEAE